ncbi:MAG: response regulator [Acidimicrobiia bacterium]
MSLRVLLADDHTMIRESLHRFLSDEGFDVVGQAGDGEEALRLAEELRPDVVLMDVSMPVLDGIEATRTLRRRLPETEVVVLTMFGDGAVADRAYRAGAAGFLAKDCSLDEVAEAIRMAADRDRDVSPSVAKSMLSTSDDLGLSRRETEVLQLIAEGASTPEVGERLFISVKTVKNHLASIYEKLDSRDRTQAVLKAVRLGIIRLDPPAK